MKIIILTLLVALFYRDFSYAETPPSLEKMSLAEYEKLPETIKGQLPAIATIKWMEKMTGESNYLKRIIIQIEDHLYDLRFYPYLPQGCESPELRNSIKDFQKSIGTAQTGNLLMSELGELDKRVNLYHFPHFSSLVGGKEKAWISVYGDGHIRVSGTWILHGEETTGGIDALHSKKYVFKIPKFNVSTITCDKKDGYCREIRSQLDCDNPAIKCWLENQEELYTIIKWGNTEVTAEQARSGYISTLTINTASEDVHCVTRDASTPATDAVREMIDKGMPNWDQPYETRLINFKTKSQQIQTLAAYGLYQEDTRSHGVFCSTQGFHEFIKQHPDLIPLGLNQEAFNIAQMNSQSVKAKRESLENIVPRVEELVSSEKIFKAFQEKIGNIKTTSPAYQKIRAEIEK